ncbi:3'-5' exonuclease [uncultured Clostridium sp.]|uniref:3'-5' exonuclease n=1 Tax=uncultured Clostridium sp. TaxID=59620 RepID=UPI0025DDD321|nr:3'-5' exonuclease [uncultured Clostridium sp.]
MNYIIFDLEFNQNHPDNKDVATPNLIFEIIQIGALKINSNFEVIDNFNKLVKPTVYSTIHPYVEKLTNITIDKVAFCDKFPYIFQEFVSFLGDEDYTLVVWGSEDLRELLRNINFHNLDNLKVKLNYIDIQQYASKHFKCPKGTKLGLKKAIELLDLNTNLSFHDAFHDAFYTYEIFKILYNKNIKSKTYTLPKSRPKLQPKEKIDMAALINQFEKIYKRDMSSEEIEMIKLAYIMGKTRQFIH